MTSAPFIAAELAISRPGVRLAAAWPALSSYRAEAELTDEPHAKEAVSIDHAPRRSADAQALFRRLVALPPPAQGASAAHVLRLVESWQSTKLVAWQTEPPTSDAAAAEAFFDREGHVAYALAKAYRARAKTLTDRGDVEAANQALASGIEALGSYYFREGILDSTGMKLVLAQTSAAKGQLELARNVHESVLDARLSTYSVFLAADSPT